MLSMEIGICVKVYCARKMQCISVIHLDSGRSSDQLLARESEELGLLHLIAACSVLSLSYKTGTAPFAAPKCVV